MKAEPHSHVWIDPNEPPIQRAPYAPWVGPRRREMKPGRTYVCRECRLTLRAETDVVNLGQPHANMYGVVPCPQCASVYRWPDRRGVIQCDDCGFTEPVEVKRG